MLFGRNAELVTGMVMPCQSAKIPIIHTHSSETTRITYYLIIQQMQGFLFLVRNIEWEGAHG